MRPLRRASFASATALFCGLGATAQAQETLTAVMHSGVRVTDPIVTTAHITRNFGYMIYDTLLGIDSEFQVHPQMADFEVSEDGLSYTFTLREGLLFHDGSAVESEDAIASLERWMQRDSGGQLIADRMESLEAEDARTFTLTLAEPFAPTLEILSKPSSLVPFIMPAEVASTSPDSAVDSFVGSGPFVLDEAAFQPGVRVVFDRFEDYVPREEPIDWTSGGKDVLVDQVVWETMPDSQTAINALMTGEIDFYENPPVDLLPILEGAPNLNVEVMNVLGSQTMGRMNFLYPPFDDVEIRRAAMMALDQAGVLAALVGNSDYYETCGAIFGCGTPLASDAGAAGVTESGDMAQAQSALEASAYDGTPVVMMHPTDVNTVSPQPVVAAAALREAGFTVDLQPMDWQTLVTRRASQDPPSEGGWNMFFTNWIIPEVNSPLNNPMVNARGDEAWFGWPEDPTLEDLRADFIAAEGEEAQVEVARSIQERVMDQVIYVPLGQYQTPWAWSDSLDGVVQAPFPLFWGVEKG